MTLFARLLFSFCLLVIATNAQAFKGFDLSKLGGIDPVEELLPDDQAFQVLNTRVDGDEIVVTWVSAPEYYLYRQNFKLVSQTEGVTFGDLQLPQGEIEEDPLFGSVEVYFGEVDVRAKIFRDPASSDNLTIDLHSQGCNKPVGICYPPQKRLASLNLANFSPDNSSFDRVEQASQVSPNASGKKINYLFYIVSAFGAGLLLVFTPCVLPMLPILSGLVVGSEPGSSKFKTGLLSLAYVLGTAVTYTAMGVAAGAAGIQLQAYFQHPIAIFSMVVILLSLAFAMFGAFDIALPAGAQGRISQWTNRLKAGSMPVAFIVGLLSALIVSACVSPLLIAALGVAIKEGSPLLGGVMMFSLAMGMGVFLIAFGLGAGWILPRAGEWMNQVKQLFGFLLLGVSVYVASAIAWVPVLLLWAALLILLGFWLWSLAREGKLQVPLRALSALSLLWGAIAFVGGMTGGDDITKPLASISYGERAGLVEKGVVFQKVYTGEELEGALVAAKRMGKPVLVDYYADWCTDCKRMDRSTYKMPTVIETLEDWSRIKVDVTKVSQQTQAAKSLFGVFGPPATLFIDSAGVEKAQLRRYGYIAEAEMLQLIKRATP